MKLLKYVLQFTKLEDYFTMCLKFDEQKEEQIEITKRHAYQMVGNLSLYIFGCFFKEQDR
jgi:hypothetical protein